MKRALLLVAALASPLAMADIEKCTAAAGLAENIMKLRQANVSASELIAATDLKLAHLLVLQAYEKPLWSSQEAKDRVIGEFRDELFVTCMRELKRCPFATQGCASMPALSDRMRGGCTPS